MTDHDTASERGEFRPGAEIEIAGTMLIGAYYAHYLSGSPFPADWAEQVVDVVLAALNAP